MQSCGISTLNLRFFCTIGYSHRSCPCTQDLEFAIEVFSFFFLVITKKMHGVPCLFFFFFLLLLSTGGSTTVYLDTQERSLGSYKFRCFFATGLWGISQVSCHLDITYYMRYVHLMNTSTLNLLKNMGFMFELWGPIFYPRILHH